ncbi:MAG: hypothetical protein KAT43_03915 [Nanoarchaeota archaeon]|nr:hypothetical protein [Nanoarchaeota archaeon]
MKSATQKDSVQKPKTSPPTGGTTGRYGGETKQPQKSPKREYKPTFEDIAYGQYNAISRTALAITDSIGWTDAMKRAREYQTGLQSQVVEMDEAIESHLSEKDSIEERIYNCRVGIIETESEIKNIEEERKKVDAQVAQLGQEALATEDSELKKQLLTDKEEQTRLNGEIEKKREAIKYNQEDIRILEERLGRYANCTAGLLQEKADLEKYAAAVTAVIDDEANIRKIPNVRRLGGR